MSIFAIIVTYNGMKWYDKCFGSLRASSQEVTPIVIDNASSDESVEYIRTHYPEAQIIPNCENLGFAKANNLGIKYALDNDADYVFLLNQDAWVEKDTIKHLVDAFKDNPDAGIVSPIHLNGAGDSLDYGFCNYMPTEFHSDAYMQTLLTYYSISFVNAAAWMISRKCIEDVGGFDTLLFIHYNEDDNYCQRVFYHGFKIMLATKGRIHHDRKNRIGYEETGMPFGQNRQEAEAKMYLGDINKPYDLDKMIRALKHKMLKKQLRLKYKEAAEIRKQIELYKKIQESRAINEVKGPNWLN